MDTQIQEARLMGPYGSLHAMEEAWQYNWVWHVEKARCSLSSNNEQVDGKSPHVVLRHKSMDSFLYWANNQIERNTGKPNYKLVIYWFLSRLYKSFVFYQNVNWWGKSNPNCDQVFLLPLWKQRCDHNFRKMTQLFWLLVSSSLKWSGLLIISGFEMISYRACFSN